MKKIEYDYLYDLYIEQNLTVNEISKIVNLAPSTVMRYIKKYELKKTSDQIKAKVKATCIERYGGQGTASEVIKAKVESTCQERFGAKSYLATDECRLQTKQYNLDTYGVEYYQQTQECKDKTKATCLERYNVDSFVKSTEFSEKAKATCLERYGTEYASQSQDFKEQVKQTCLERYGGQGAASPQILNKIQETCKERYGTAHFFKSAAFADIEPLLQEKRQQTLRENCTFNTSSPEQRVLNYLLTIFDSSDIFTQYKDNVRYPFNCDFYIKSKDLFIELNITWTHGGHPFDSTSEDDKHILSIWQEKAKTSDYYKNAIDTWTVRDLKKYEAAAKSNINYIVYFNEADVYEDRRLFQ